jgi:hypothetical protein
LKRNEDFSLSAPERLSEVSTEGMSGNIIEEFLYLFKGIAEELGMKEHPEKLFNVNKTGLSTNNYPEEQSLFEEE